MCCGGMVCLGVEVCCDVVCVIVPDSICEDNPGVVELVSEALLKS